MKKRTFIRICSFFAAIVLFLTGLYIKEVKASNRYKNMLQNEYSQALYSLDSSVNVISTVLEKMAFVTSPGLFSSYAAQTYCEAELAKMALSKLPGGSEDLSTIYKFLSQVGNYALSMSKDMISGNDISKTQKDNLDFLSETAKTVAQVVSDSKISFNNADYWAKEIEDKLNSSIDTATLASSLSELEENLSDYPTLIYDGPYSDHILTKEPLMLSNKAIVSENQALLTASKISGLEKEKFSNETAQHGKIECYRFESEEGNISISKSGGYPVYMIKNRNVAESNITADSALEKAEKYLLELGFDNMQKTYYQISENICVINFAFVDGQTLCYTDLIKVGIAMDTGEVLQLETVGYLTNHTDRVFEAVQHSQEEAAATLSSGLVYSKAQITLIPTDGGGEVRCYEFVCSTGNEEILVYINAKTLECQRILITINTEAGTLVK